MSTKNYDKEPWEDKSVRILRYQYIIDRFFGTKTRFAEAIHVTGQSISSVMRTGTGVALEKISYYLPNLSMDYLINGVGDPLIDPDLPITSTPGTISKRVRVCEIEEEETDRADIGEAMREEQRLQSEDPDHEVAEPTASYAATQAMQITIPLSILTTLQNQLKVKDQQLEDAAAQIATLYGLINK